MSENFTLALETGISGGSICLFIDQKEKFSWTGEGKNINSGDFLRALRNLLDNYNVEKSSLDKILISEGPGSFTGLRIGFSIVKALKLAYRCKIVRISIIDTLLIKRLITIVVYQLKEDELIWRLSKENNVSEFEIVEYNGSYIEFLNFIRQKSIHRIIANDRLYNRLCEEGRISETIELIMFPANLATLMGRYYFSSEVKE